MAGSCPRGYIKRKAYSRKSHSRKSFRRTSGIKVRGSRVSGSRVKASCIKDVGARGKGKRVITDLKKGELTSLGYSTSSPRTSRRKALRRASRKFSKSELIKKLNVLNVYNKRSHPKTAKKARQDMEYVRTLYKD